jgi:hypothetical protein
MTIAAAASLGAWWLQAAAAGDLAEARQIQGREVGSEGGGPPSPEDNRRIIDSLDASIEVRRQIDEQLQRIEASVQALSASQTQARAVTLEALRETKRIAELLGGADVASRTAIQRLGGLQGRLRASAGLAEKIADELAELDRRLGPSVGRRR